MNAFPVKNVISDKLSPMSIVVRANLYWKNHYKMVVRKYCEVHNEPEHSNNMTPQLHESIY